VRVLSYVLTWNLYAGYPVFMVPTMLELQWIRMVEDLHKKGSLRNCIAVCDVSGSLHGTPMEVCCTLGLLISELSFV
jgi:hypothetical protein